MEKPSLSDRRLRQMFRDLERALAQAIAASPEIVESLRRVRAEGYRLEVVFDCQPQASESATAVAGPAPTFRIHGEDLAFLRSIGIDPTRQRRPRRVE